MLDMSEPAAPKGPKPLDPALPREVIAVPAPAPGELDCPATRKLVQPGFVQILEVLACRPAAYFVKRYERTVFAEARAGFHARYSLPATR
jgi:transposase